MEKSERESEKLGSILGSMERSQGKKERAKQRCNEMLIQPERSDCPPGRTVPQNNAPVRAWGWGTGGTGG